MPLLHINRYFEEVEVGLVAVINRRPVLVGKLNLAELAIDALMPRPALVQVQLPTYYRLAVLPRDYGAERLLQAETKTSLAILPRRSLSKFASPQKKPPPQRGLSENPTGGSIAGVALLLHLDLYLEEPHAVSSSIASFGSHEILGSPSSHEITVRKRDPQEYGAEQQRGERKA